MKRCERCNSRWVCWNWMDMSSPESTNPNQEWMHECWNCAATQITNGAVTNGVPYWLLKHVGRYFVDDELFEKNLAKDMAEASTMLEAEPWDDTQE